MNKLTFTLSISPTDYYAYYTGEISHVLAHTLDGTLVQFSAHHLRQFITHDGIQGQFEMTYNDNNECIHFQRL